MCSHSICESIGLGKCALDLPTCEVCKDAPAVGTTTIDRGSFGFVKWACEGCKDRGRGLTLVAETNLGRMRREAGL